MREQGELHRTPPGPGRRERGQDSSFTASSSNCFVYSEW